MKRSQLRTTVRAVALVAVALMIVSASAPGANAATRRTLYVFGYGFYTAPALGAAFPAQQYMKVPPKIAVDTYNASKDHKFTVSYTFCDTQDTPTGSEACARQAGSPTGCDGHPCDIAFDVVDLDDELSVPAIAKEGVPIVGEDVNTPAALDTPNMFCTTGTLEATAKGIGAVLKKDGVSRAGYIGEISAGQTSLQSWVLAGLQAQHIHVTGTQSVQPTDVNMAPTVSAVMANGANGLAPLAGTGATGAAITYVNNAYPNAKIGLASYEFTAQFIHGIPASILDRIVVAAWSQPITATKVPGVAQYVKQVLPKMSASFQYYDNSLLAWLDMKFIINVASTVHGSFSSKSMLAALKSAKNVDMYGVVPPYTAANRGKSGAVPCSPYFADVQEHVSNSRQVADYPGVFANPLTGKTVYVDPGFTAPKK